MPQIDVFTARDLRNNAGHMLRDAENGKLSIITKHGHPTALAIPFDEKLLSAGLHHSLAVRLYELGLSSMVQASKIAEMSVEDFLDILKETDVVSVDYSNEELRREAAELLSSPSVIG